MFNSFSSSGYFYANRQLNSNAPVTLQNALTNFNVVGVGINCFTFTWTTPTFAVTQYNLTYNDGTILNIPASNITRNIQYGIGITSSSTTFHTLPSVLCGNSGTSGSNSNISSGLGGRSISTSVNNITFASGSGGKGDTSSDAGVNTDGVCIIIPELDISYNFSGGGSGGNLPSTIEILDACWARSRIYGCGVGGHTAIGVYGKTGSTAGTAYTGGGGAGRSRLTPYSITGGSGVVYMYYSTYYFTVDA